LLKDVALPLGTGVIHEALCFASSKSTSPTKRFPLLRVGSVKIRNKNKLIYVTTSRQTVAYQ